MSFLKCHSSDGTPSGTVIPIISSEVEEELELLDRVWLASTAEEERERDNS